MAENYMIRVKNRFEINFKQVINATLTDRAKK